MKVFPVISFKIIIDLFPPLGSVILLENRFFAQDLGFPFLSHMNSVPLIKGFLLSVLGEL